MNNVLLKIITEFDAWILAFLHVHTGMDKIMKTSVEDTRFFINTELVHHLPVI